MITEQNKDFMRRFLQASVASDQAEYKELLAPDFVAHLLGGPQNRRRFYNTTTFSTWLSATGSYQ